MNKKQKNSDVYIQIKQVCFLLGLSRNGLNCLMKRDPTFPEPIKNVESQQGGVSFVYMDIKDWYDRKLLNRL